MNTRYTVKYRRRREGKTDYHKRIKLLSAKKEIVVFRKLSRTIIGSITRFDPRGDKIVASASSKELKEFGWAAGGKNVPASYLTGFLLAKKYGKQSSEAIANFGISSLTKGSSGYSFLKGAIDGGLKIRNSIEGLADKSRIKGKHIEGFSKSPEAKKISALFEEVKKKIESMKNER